MSREVPTRPVGVSEAESVEVVMIAAAIRKARKTLVDRCDNTENTLADILAILEKRFIRCKQ